MEDVFPGKPEIFVPVMTMLLALFTLIPADAAVGAAGVLMVMVEMVTLLAPSMLNTLVVPALVNTTSETTPVEEVMVRALLLPL